MINMEDKIVTFKVFDNSPSANIVLEKLKDNNIQCFLTDQNMLTMDPLFNQAMGGIRLKIFEKDIEKAHEILNEPNELSDSIVENDTVQEIVCPSCHSTNVA